MKLISGLKMNRASAMNIPEFENTETFRFNPVHPEVTKKGPVNDSLQEQYPHVYTFPVLSRDYCEFLEKFSEQLAEETGYGILFLDEIDDDVLSQFETKVCDAIVSKLVEELTSKSYVTCWGSPYIVSFDESDKGSLGVSSSEADYTLVINLGGRGVGGMYFPKPHQKRSRAVDPPVGCGILYPSVFESGMVHMGGGRAHFLVLPITLDQEN